eukprot:12003708-Alexandrium_andersonii.AAC.1
MEVLLGHITWTLLLRREGLALLQSVYAFVGCRGLECRPLWPAVRRELEWVSALIPLFVVRTDA